MSWQMHKARNRLGELIDRALRDGPQTITRRGREVAVVLSFEEYRKLTKPQKSLLQFFRDSPLVGQIDLRRRGHL